MSAQVLQSGSLLQGGRYKIVRFISSGGFGNTYEGIHTMMDTSVAIKEFFPKMFCDRDESTSHVTIATNGNRELVDKLRKKFNEEAKVVFKMKHDNIIRVLDIFDENGTAYYVMEYIDGKSLNEISKERGALPETESVGYIRQIADALKYVHSLNRLHLDIKPGNIMVDRDGKAILIDFGASKYYDMESGENTSTLMGVNTKGYAPIEQSTQSFTSFSPATDIYALGATLYKLLTGITPPDANLLMAEEENLQPLPDTVSASTRNTVMAAMTLRRKGRPQSVDAFFSLLDAGPGQKKLGNDREDESTIIETQSTGPRSEPADKVGAKTYSPDIRTFEVKGVSFQMVEVRGGTFLMGATPEQGSEAESNEEPVHKVTLDSYYIGMTEVTQALWKAIMGTNFWGTHKNPSHFKGDDLPVENVSWNDCRDFITKLNDLTGETFRLPTEAEWEFAAKGGNNSRCFKYCGSDNLDEVAWYGGNSGQKTHPVATKDPNELGLYDMSGNVWEWCSDWYGAYSGNSQTNPTGPSSGSSLVLRGGDCFYSARDCRSSRRETFFPNFNRLFGHLNCGLRLILL